MRRITDFAAGLLYAVAVCAMALGAVFAVVRVWG